MRIATHPDFQGMGYGTATIKYLVDYFEGKFASLNESQPLDTDTSRVAVETGGGLLKETIAPRTHLPPLLTKLSDRPPERLDYLGVSYGLTAQLHK